MLTPFNFTYRKLHVLEDIPRHDYQPDPERCITYECENIVPEDGETCESCQAYFAEIAADCAGDYINRPASQKQVTEAAEAYSEPSERAKRDRMLEVMEEF